MRGSFGGSYGLGRSGGGFNGGGGGGGGGGDLLRTVGRVMRTRINGGIQDPFPNSSSSSATSNTRRSTTPPKTRNYSTSKNGLTISNNNNNNGNIPVSAAWSSCPNVVPDVVGSNDGEIDDEWECLEDYYDPLFGVVPSTHEVNHAVFSLQQFLHPSPSSQSDTEELLHDVDKHMLGQKMRVIDVLQRASSAGSELDWIEPSMELYDQRLGQSSGWEKVYDAFHMLQTEPSVQKMVVSLSSDKAVWDAVLNNETVREIRDSYLNAAEARTGDTTVPSDTDSNVLKWIMDHMKGKLMEVLGNVAQFVGGIFKPLDRDKAEEPHPFSEKLKSSFLLTIVVLLIVVVTRGSKA